MTDIKCEYCGKVFTSVYSLTKHKKTAGYCIEIQRKQFNIEPNVVMHACEYCGQEFTTKTNYNIHISACKAKKEHDKLEEFNNLRIKINNVQDEVEKYKRLYESQCSKLYEYEKELSMSRLLCEEKDKQLVKYEHEIERIKMEKNEEIEQLKQQIREKDEHIRNTPHTTIYQTNNNNSKYELC